MRKNGAFCDLQGRRMTFREASAVYPARCGNAMTYYHRRKRGWPAMLALTMPRLPRGGSNRKGVFGRERTASMIENPDRDSAMEHHEQNEAQDC
jgi:hypothetical protein